MVARFRLGSVHFATFQSVGTGCRRGRLVSVAALSCHLSLITNEDGRRLEGTTPMNSSNLFVLGLLLLTANLSLGALFSPARSGRAGADRLLLLWKLLLLAAIQIGAWAIVLQQGGAAPTLADSFTRSAACFALIGGSGGGLAPPWGEVAPFIALNGLLFIPVALLPLLRGPVPNSELEPVLLPPPLPPPLPVSTQKERVAGASLSEMPVSAAVPSAAVAGVPIVAVASVEQNTPKSVASTQNQTVTGAASAPSPEGARSRAASRKAADRLKSAPPDAVNLTPAKSGEANPVDAANPAGPELQRGGFRPRIPKAQRLNVQLTPEEELMEQMKPIGPTPPPIRFEWKN